MDTDQLKTWLGTGAINIFGRPFAGKDTQGKKLAKIFSGRLMGGGEILRSSTIPDHITAALHRGELIPSEDYVKIVLPFLSNNALSGTPLILSSVGRWIGEETGVMEALDAAHHPLKSVVYLDLPEEEVIQRWKALEHNDDRGGRHDDTEEILNKRLKEYRLKTIPVIHHYDQLGLLDKIDATGSIEEVHARILDALTKRASV